MLVRTENARTVERAYRPAKRNRTLSNPRRKAMAKELAAARTAAGAPPTGQVAPGRLAQKRIGWPDGEGGDAPFTPRIGGAVRSVPIKGSGGKAGLGQNFQGGLGQHLTRRVEDGAVSQDRAEETAAEQALMEKAYGPDWRRKIYGDRGYVQRVRIGLAKEPDNPEIQALYTGLMETRKKALERAKAKVGS